MIERLRRGTRIRCFFDHVHSGTADKHVDCIKIVHRRILTKMSKAIEGAINRFEESLRVDFGALENARSSNLTIL